MRLLWGASIVACATVLLAGCRGKGEWVEEEHEIGYVGEARRDPFLAFKRLMGKRGFETRRVVGVAKLPSIFGTLILSAEAASSHASPLKLERWVRDGGHLVYCLEGAGRRETRRTSNLVPDPSRDPILARFGFQLAKEAASTGSATVEIERGESLDLEMGRRYAVEVEGGLGRESFKDSGDSPHRFLSVRRGQGRFSVLSSAAMWRNDQIGDGDHARFAVRLIELGWEGELWFVTEPDRSIFPLLWSEGWMVLLSLAALILFWLWKNLQRFGPLSEGEGVGLGGVSAGRFGEHLATSGRFLWRRKCSPILLEPMRRSIIRQYQIERPEGDPDGLGKWVVKRSGLPADRVAKALEEIRPRDGATMVAIVRDLQTIEQKL